MLKITGFTPATITYGTLLFNGGKSSGKRVETPELQFHAYV